MAAPAVVAAGTVASGAAAINPGLPAGWAPGHLHLLFAETSNEPIPAMSGWSNLGAGTINIATGTVTALTVRYRVAMAGDTAPTVPDSGDHQIARILGVSGTPLASQQWDAAPVFSTDATSGTTVSFPTLTTTVIDTLIVHAVATGQDVATGQVSGAGTNANLTGLTNQMNNWAIIQGGGGFAVITGVKASIGAIGTTTVPITTGNPKALFTVALKSAPPDEVWPVMLYAGTLV